MRESLLIHFSCCLVFKSALNYFQRGKIMKKSVLKVCSIVFGALCLCALIVLLCLSISLPYTETYRVWGTVYTQSYSGYFDTTHLESMILLAFGSFWGFVLFFAFGCDKCRKVDHKEEEVKSVDVSESVSSCCCCSQTAEETEDKED